MTIAHVFDYTVSSLLALYEPGEAAQISYMLFEEKTGMNKAEIRVRGEEIISEVKANLLAYALVRLMKGEPIQYVLGSVEFFGIKLKVNKSVLIPRPETEELVEWILKDIQMLRRETIHILDIGTGSGCIAIALKKNIAHADLWAIDISEESLQVARENANIQNTEIHFLRDDILQPGQKSYPPAFDIIVSNPPYVLNSEKSSMHKNVVNFEPEVALFVPDNDPLIFYREVISFAKSHLSKGGKLFFELHETQGEHIKELLLTDDFTKVILKKDLSGKDRMVQAASSQ